MKKKINISLLFNYLWLIITIIIPTLLIFFLSIRDESTNELSLINYSDIFSAQYINIFINSLLFALIITILTILFSYILIFSLKYTGLDNNFFTFLIILPIFTNIMLRIYAWIVIFYKGNILDDFFQLFSINIQYSPLEVYSGMIYNFFPFMFLPILNSINKIDNNIINAAADVGANKYQIIKKILLPLSKDGLITGINMVFLPSITIFAIPQMLSAGKYNLIGNVIERQFTSSNNINFGCALVIFIYLIIIILYILKFFIKKVLNK